MIYAKILADSLNSETDDRLTTFELEYPYIIHAQFMTHRMFSRNAQSSRAIPVEKLVQRVLDNPYIPEQFGRNQRGMSSSSNLVPRENRACQHLWKMGLLDVVKRIEDLKNFEVHKQWINRLLMPWQHIKVICSGTDSAYENFFRLRCADDAQPEIQQLANEMAKLRTAATPSLVDPGDWHLPLGDDLVGSGLTPDQKRKVCIARCARVSYLTHDGVRDYNRDIELYDQLLADKHMSPFEHVAVADDKFFRYANYDGWASERCYRE